MIGVKSQFIYFCCLFVVVWFVFMVLFQYINFFLSFLTERVFLPFCPISVFAVAFFPYIWSVIITYLKKKILPKRMHIAKNNFDRHKRPTKERKGEYLFSTFGFHLALENYIKFPVIFHARSCWNSYSQKSSKKVYSRYSSLEPRRMGTNESPPWAANWRLNTTKLSLFLFT